jgi:hypothetical protein
VEVGRLRAYTEKEMKYVENLLLYIVLEVKQGLLCDEND